MATPLKFAVVALALGLSMPSFAEESHHPSASPAQTAPTPQAAPGVPSPMRPGMGPGGMSMGGQDGMMGPGGMMGGPVMSMMHGSERIEGRLAFIKAELKITEAQEKLWADLAGTLREAIDFHGGEGAASRAAFQALSPADQERLLRFLESL